MQQIIPLPFRYHSVTKPATNVINTTNNHITRTYKQVNSYTPAQHLLIPKYFKFHHSDKIGTTPNTTEPKLNNASTKKH